MRTHFSIFAIVVAFFAVMLAMTGTAQAAARSIYHGGSYFGSVVVEEGQVVEGDINVVGGDVTVAGTVDGDVNVVGGNIYLRGDGKINGQEHAIGGEVAQSVVPWAASSDDVQTYMPDHRMWWRIAWDVVVLVFFLIFPLRTRMAVGRLEQHPALATGVGLLGWVAVVPLLILLAVTVVLIPLIFVEFVLLTAAVFIGTAALALLIGRRFYELLSPNATPTPLIALVLGLTLLTAAQLVPVVGVLVSLLTALVGLGAVLLTFVPEATPPVGGVGPRPTIGGPPMPIG
ncbi:MAG: hypothetical protein JOZ01_09105 [Candidatus Eremiobacteraeota bacterium]|nr:hypothetical protein [Candidatus Eremiobacteraeota bacterium]